MLIFTYLTIHIAQLATRFLFPSLCSVPHCLLSFLLWEFSFLRAWHAQTSMCLSGADRYCFHRAKEFSFFVHMVLTKRAEWQGIIRLKTAQSYGNVRFFLPIIATRKQFEKRYINCKWNACCTRCTWISVAKALLVGINAIWKRNMGKPVCWSYSTVGTLVWSAVHIPVQILLCHTFLAHLCRLEAYELHLNHHLNQMMKTLQ